MDYPISRYAIQGDGSFHDIEDICLDRDWGYVDDYYIFDRGLSFKELYKQAIARGADRLEVIEVLSPCELPF
jgi:hypothetical protein